MAATSMDLAADVDAICRRHGVPEAALTLEVGRLSPLIEDGVCRFEDGCVRVTPAGRSLVRLVAAAFDSYLEPEGERHSRAV